ncbi:BadF/BadG/BcrA/BcrD ATPase family protein [Agromyces sp. G08B096]|uniref:BadF/BadG/BcrA/BcrD ATPase family protein n=1 Tax=Agromyces sp. G08B096 TaxID=3156399 RepID=A0AAU7W8L3_9MICO
MTASLQGFSRTRALVVGVDLGGTGSRAALEPVDARLGAEPGARRTLDGARVAVASDGSNVIEVAEALISAVRLHWPGTPIAAIGVGAAGVTSLVADPPAAARRLARVAGAPVALAADAVTAHVGALGGEAGTVVTVGTGTIALGTDLAATWRRVGGWGHLYDDRGSGAWVGIAALRAAIETHDGLRDDGGALLGAAVARFGPPPSWPAQLYPRGDRGGVLAGLATEVARLADDGDPAAAAILDEAGRLAAGTLAAALDPALPPTASYAGGMFASPRFAAAFRREFRLRAPDARLREPAGTPLDGAVGLARRLATAPDGLGEGHPPYLWIGR